MVQVLMYRKLDQRLFHHRSMLEFDRQRIDDDVDCVQLLQEQVKREVDLERVDPLLGRHQGLPIDYVLLRFLFKEIKGDCQRTR